MKVKYRKYICRNCGCEQQIQTNHTDSCIDYCKGCSWKPSFGNPAYRIPFGGHTYRPFDYFRKAKKANENTAIIGG